MNFRNLAIVAAFVLSFAGIVCCFDGGDASSGDAPDASFTVDLGSYYLLKGSSPERIDLLEAIDLIDGFTPHFSFPGALCGGTVDDGGLPGWISVEKSEGGSSASDATVHLVIDPVYAADAKDYWVWLDNTQNSKTFLFILNVEVEDSDPTVTPEGSYSYTVVFDTHGGSPIGPLYHKSHSGSWVVGLSDYVPVKDGYEFKGWSPDASGESIYGPNLTLSGTEGGETIVTLHAVWEPAELRIPTFFDGLIELFTDPLVIIGCLLFLVAVAAFIRGRM